jgi:hypothetical protein
MVILLYPIPFSSADPTNQSIIEAQAGNVTELLIYSEQHSDHWAGTYGNITGIIVLDDAQNWTMYHWVGITYPEGEIYAANNSVTNWGAVMCMNLSGTQPGFNCTGADEECLNITELESYFGMDSTDADGFDETFNTTQPEIMIGTKTLYNCSKTNLYINDSIQTDTNWNETILTINNTGTVIFAGIIQNDMWGYSNQTWDFQLMLAEDGSNPAPTTYYMYVELS